jgi:predicted ATPase
MAVGEQQLSAIERDGSHRFPDGVFFVPLESIESASEIVPTLCRVLEFQPADEGRVSRSIEVQLLEHLRRKQLLLIFDNYEHLLDGVSLLSKVRHSAPGVHLLITSRQKLALQGERIYGLDGLSYPLESENVTNAGQLVTDYSAADLFVSSARRAVSDFKLSDSDIPALIRLCHLVDGLPLAIELAAGWTNVLSVTDIVVEIEKGLSFLFSDLSDLPDRHRSLEAVFDVSWQRLTMDEQRVFAQLCVFRGGFSRIAAGKVVGASIRQLATLVNKALLQYDKKLNRYQIHRLLRQFGAGRLAQDPAAERNIHNCHCSFYSSVLHKWAERLKGARQLETLAEFEMESANVRTAWYYALETGQDESIDQAADGLGRFYLWRRRFHEGETATKLAEETLLRLLSSDSPNGDHDDLLRILTKIQLWQSVFCKRDEAVDLVDQACQTLRQPELEAIDIRNEKAFAWQRAGDMAFENDSLEAQDFYRRSLALYRDLNDDWGVSTSLTAIGWLAAHDGEPEKARYLGEEALKICRNSGDLKRTADALWLLGTLAVAQGQVEESGRLLGESLDIRASLGDRITDIAVGPVDLGMTLTWIGRMAEADEVREEALALYEAQGQPEQIGLAHVALGTSKMHLGQYELAKRHGRIGLALCKKEGNFQGAGRALWLLSGLAINKGELDEAETLAQESLGYLQQVEGAAEIGWVLVLFAEIARRKNSMVEARNYLYEALTTGAGVMSLVTSLLALTVYINLIADSGEKEKAVELGALLEMQPIINSSGGIQIFYANRSEEVKKSLPPEKTAALETCGRARNLRETAAEIVDDLAIELETVVVT